jgi:hypothetical protein
VKWLKKKGVPFREVIDILCRSSSDAERAALLRKYRFAREAVQTLVALSRTYPDTVQLEREFWQRSIRRIFQQQRIPAAREEMAIYFPDFNAKLERVMKGLEPKLKELTRAEPSRLRRKYRDIISRNPRNRPEALLNESLLSPTR